MDYQLDQQLHSIQGPWNIKYGRPRIPGYLWFWGFESQ